MARVNTEECWWSDPRRSALIKAVGEEERADGLALKMWRLAQKFWESERRLIPKSIFETLPHHAELVRCHLAEAREDMIYVRGSSQYLDWTIEERAKRVAGGKKSAETRRKKYGSAVPKNASNSNKKPNKRRTPAEVTSDFNRSAPNKTEVSGSGSGFSSSSKNKETTTTANEKKAPTREEIQTAYSVWSETLRSFGVQATAMNVRQENSLYRAIEYLGFETVCLALEGQRFEAPTKDFRPKEHLSLDRALHRNPRTGVSHWEKLMNLALGERAKLQTDKDARTRAEATA